MHNPQPLPKSFSLTETKDKSLLNKLSNYMLVENFFVDILEPKVSIFKSSSNSFFPILQPRKDDKDFYSPTYMSDLEIKVFLKPLILN